MTYRIGIDAGSKTIKIVVLNEDGTVERAAYRRHRADIKTTLSEVAHDLVWRYGNVAGSVAVTGSAGIELAEMLGVPFVQEVVATTRIVQKEIPEADAIIELGGEDAKIVYLAGGLEQRMNATCAGGTGGFIDTIAFMLGVSSKEMSSLAMGSTKTYPIASRCAVFAQTDVRPLLNAGAKKSDIAASALDAVVKQTLGGLACGRPITGTTVFLGGPLEHIPSLVHRFRRALDLDHRTGIKPADAHLFTAKGAALLSDDAVRLDAPVAHLSLAELEEALGAARAARNDLPRLSPLFSSDAEYEAFKERHAAHKAPRKRFGDAEGTVYLGIDAGSTAVKLALVDEDGCLLHSDYQPVAGNVLATAAEMLLDLYRAMPREYDGTPLCTIGHATVTGYGESLLMAAFGVDSGVVETTAHLQAARSLCPKADFVLDIGGQDMKALWVENGAISKAVLNEACSSGCGSFIEGSAHSLRSTPHAFAQLALKATAPVDLGTKCTVFMTSRVRHAQKVGASAHDIAAGIAYSVVNNALFKVIGLDSLDSLGKTAVVQGGAFLSDAVLRAFELVSGKQVVRPDIAHLMGAYGAALVARSRADGAASSLLDSAAISTLEPRYRTETCPGCANACALSIVTFEESTDPERKSPARAANLHRSRDSRRRSPDDRCFVDGNRCERAYSFFENARGRIGGQLAARGKAPNTVALEQGLLNRYKNVSSNGSDSPRRNVVVGLPCALNEYETLPFWHTLMASLGFSIAVGGAVDLGLGGVDTIPSESVCYPAKIVHQRISSLLDQGVDAVFMPEYERGSHCPVSSLYARAVRDSMPAFRSGTAKLVSPKLSSSKPARIASCAADRASLLAALQHIVPQAVPLTEQEIERALSEADNAQARFVSTMEHACRKALDRIDAERGRGIVLAGRPYHIDPALSHGIDTMLAALGFAVLSPIGLTGPPRTMRAAAEHGGTPSELRSEDELAVWKQGKRLNRLATFASSRENVDMVCLQSFGCAYDAASIREAEQILEATGRSLTALKIDEIADTAHILIRLRTLADTIEERRAGAARANGTAPDASPERGEASDRAVQRPQTIELGRIEAEDIEIGRREVSQDICSTVAAVAGRIIRLCRTDPSIGTVVVPEGCASCLFDALPDLVENPLGFSPRIILRKASDPAWAAFGNAAAPCGAFAQSESNGIPRIGILGNPYMVFEAPLNDGLVDFLGTLCCEAIMPDANALLVDDVRFIDQLEAFEAAGVDHVVYAQSFGCLKGHVEVRGALHGLKERFATVPITVIDYDPDASALNRKNRILLVVEATRNAHASDDS